MLTSISSRAVKTTFRSFGIWVGPVVQHRLARIDDKKYNDLSQLISGYARNWITRMAVPGVDQLEGIDFSAIPDSVIDACVSPRWIMPGKLMDLRKLESALHLYYKEQRINQSIGAGRSAAKDPQDQITSAPAPFSPERPQDLKIESVDPESMAIPHPVRLIKEERTLFKAMVERPDCTVERIFEKLDEIKEKLGFLNVVIYRPLSNGKWVLTKPTKNYIGSRYALEKGGAFPQDTLKSVIEGRETMYEVNINDPKSFERAGLAINLESLENEKKHSKGSGQKLKIKLESRFGVEAVIYIHNRVNKSEKDAPLYPVLPAKRDQAEAIKAELQLYFDEVVQAIERVKERGGLIDSGKTFSAERFLPPSHSRMIYKEKDKSVSIEIIDHPVKKGAHILGSFFNFINQIAMDAWAYFPADFVRERLLDVTKAICIRVRGEVAAYTSARKKMMGGQGVHWFEIGITKRKFQQMGLQAKAFYQLYKEAYLEEVAKYLTNKWKMPLYISILLSLPAVIKAICYVNWKWAKNAPKEIAGIKVPIAFLAVQPTSVGPFYDYIGDIYPQRDRPDAEPSPEMLKIAKVVLPHGARLDPKNLVVEGDYVGIEHLIPDPARGTEEGGVLNYKDDRVNEMMWKRLHYEDKAGRDQMVIMNVCLADFRRFKLSQKQKRSDEENTSDFLKLTKNI